MDGIKYSTILKLSDRPGSPCINCLVKVTCQRSFVDGSACMPFAEYVHKLIGLTKMNKGKRL